MRSHLDPPADDAAAKEIALEMNTSLEPPREQPRDRRFPGRHRSGDEIHGVLPSGRLHLLSLERSAR